jgi:hypothetical protein
VRADHAVLVEQGELALDLQHALDHEHHVRPAGVVFVEHQGARVLQCPGQDALAELGDLLAVLQDDGVLADQVDAADVAVEVDADAGPVEPRRHLLDMRALAGAVIALDHAAAVEGEAREDGDRRFAVEAVGVVHLRHVLGAGGEGGHLHVDVHAEHLAGITVMSGWSIALVGRNSLKFATLFITLPLRCRSWTDTKAARHPRYPGALPGRRRLAAGLAADWASPRRLRSSA